MQDVKIFAYFFTFFAAVFFFNTTATSALALSVPILMYHYIGNNPNPKDTARNALSVTPDNFNAQMDYLAKNGYTPITLDTLYGIFDGQASAPSKPVVLTFDDGYVDFYYNAYPILRAHNFHAVSFLISGLVDTSYYIHWNQVEEISHSGLVTFEDHTVTHAYLPGLSYQGMISQTSVSKQTIEAHTHYPVNFIAYPSGGSDGLVWQAVRASGIVGGVGTWYGLSSGPGLDMPRVRVSGGETLSTFASRL